MTRTAIPQALQALGHLPVSALHRDFTQALEKGHVVVTAPTGSGKSTIVPLWCALGGKVLVVEPRRVACRSLARFLSLSMGQELGRVVGYQVRFEDRAGPDCLVSFVTPGVALRRAEEGDLAFSVIIIDELHERGMESDLFLALCQRAGRHRLVVMSATMDAERVADHLGASVLRAEGRVYPVEVAYHGGEEDIPSSRHLDRRVVEAVGRVRNRKGHILVFLPGKAEISASLRALRASHPDLEALPLHAELAVGDQDKAFDPSETRRVILSTNVAETSVTLPGVGVVIDSGLVRQTTFRAGRTVLALGPVSQASAEQRRGRAGRLFPGHCLRLWNERGRLEPESKPEILRRGLEEVVLSVAAHGARVGDLPFLDGPKEYAVEAAESSLKAMGALGPEGRITPLGREMVRLALPPAWARVALECRDRPDVAGDSVDLFSALSVNRPLFLRQVQGEAREELIEPGCDATALILALRRGHPHRHGLDTIALTEARRGARELRRALGLPPFSPDQPVGREALALAILRALPWTGHVQRPRRDAWANGEGEVVLARESVVSEKAEALVVVDSRSIQAKGRRTVTMATCNIPVTRRILAKAGLGQPRLGFFELKGDGKIVGLVERVLAAVVLVSHEEEIRGPLAIEAAVELARRGKLWRRDIEALKGDVEAWNLHLALHGERKEGPVDWEGWLRARLEELGVEGGEDMALVMPEDLRLEGLTDQERLELDRRFPRRLSLGGLTCTVEYDPLRRQVTLVKEAGTLSHLPSLALLPPWPGWKVFFRDRQRVVPLQ